MKRRMRIAVAGVLAVVLGGGLASLLVASLARGGQERPPVPVLTREMDARPTVAAQPVAAIDGGSLVNAKEPDAPAVDPPPDERPIEEILATSGEDPGAVFYMSRVREAIRNGNPAFGRELLEYMRREHGNSILVLEAERLFE